MESIKNNWKRYAWSSFVTFIAVFIPILATDLSQLNLEVAGLSALGVVCMRAALKAITELFVKYEK